MLDLGCGTGLFTSRLRHERHPELVVGCDFSGGMLDQAHARDPEVGWVQGDAQRLPFADAAFDTVLSTESFHWYPDQPAALLELHRILRPGGRLLVSLFTPPYEAVSRVADRSIDLTGQSAHFPTRDEMRTLLTAAGFELEGQHVIRHYPRFGVTAPVITIGVRPQD